MSKFDKYFKIVRSSAQPTVECKFPISIRMFDALGNEWYCQSVVQTQFGEDIHRVYNLCNGYTNWSTSNENDLFIDKWYTKTETGRLLYE